MIRTMLVDALAAPTFGGLTALFVSVAALAIPTGILSLDHALPAGACCTTYFPFVLLSAVLLGPTYASIVALGSAGLADALFMGPRYQLFESPMDAFGDTASLVSSAFIIGLVVLFRMALAEGRQAVRLGPPADVYQEPAEPSRSSDEPRVLQAQLASQMNSDFEELLTMFDLRLSLYHAEDGEAGYLALKRARDAALRGAELSRRLSGKIQG